LLKIYGAKYIEKKIGINHVKGNQNKFLAKTTIQGLKIKTEENRMLDFIEKSLLTTRDIKVTNIAIKILEI
tara:strand:+ start:131 stop:343 length:213 start_codon:yes stop_codon:yes gene_type:complete